MVRNQVVRGGLKARAQSLLPRGRINNPRGRPSMHGRPTTPPSACRPSAGAAFASNRVDGLFRTDHDRGLPESVAGDIKVSANMEAQR